MGESHRGGSRSAGHKPSGGRAVVSLGRRVLKTMNWKGYVSWKESRNVDGGQFFLGGDPWTERCGTFQKSLGRGTSIGRGAEMVINWIIINLGGEGG